MESKDADIDALYRGRATKTCPYYWRRRLDAQHHQRCLPAWYRTTKRYVPPVSMLTRKIEHGHDHGHGHDHSHGPVSSTDGIELENVHAPRSATEASFDAAVCR